MSNNPSTKDAVSAVKNRISGDTADYAAEVSQRSMVDAMTANHIDNMQYLTDLQQWDILDLSTNKMVTWHFKPMNLMDKKWLEKLDDGKNLQEIIDDPLRKEKEIDVPDWLRFKKAEKYLGMTLDQFMSADIIMLTAVIQACDLVRQNFRKLRTGT
jgi:hypothetical protein